MKNALILSALLTLGPVCFAQQTEKYPWAIMRNLQTPNRMTAQKSGTK